MNALLVVDPQIDFITGSLPVAGAREAMDRLAQHLGRENYDLKIVTMDQHPWNHCSFAGSGGQWPAHCVEWSQGAAIWPALLDALYGTPGPVHFLAKGTRQDCEEYSIFQNSASRARLLDILADPGINRVDVCGIAGDICVLGTLRDGIELMGADKFNVLEEFSPSLDGGESLRSFLRSQYGSDHPAFHR